MNQTLKKFLKRYAFLVLVKKTTLSSWEYGKRILNRDHIKIIDSLPLYVPSSAGGYRDIAKLTLQASNQVFPFMNHLLETVGKSKNLKILPVESLCTDKESKDCAEKLKHSFNTYGSDKCTHHNYHLLYGSILKNKESITAVLEIGLGTNNTDVVSNMSALGKPGASLRAFRDTLPHALIYGADVDKRILFKEERIKTFFVDQTNLESFNMLNEHTKEKFDLIIDDGLHAPNANIATLTFALGKLKPGGSFVIEDIPIRALSVWHVVATLLPLEYTSSIISTLNNSHVFLVEKSK